MKVLILTNPDYVDFVSDIVSKYDVDWTIQFLGEVTFPFMHYDIGISFMYTHKVPAEEVNSHKWYNFHPAPLPAYKGRNLCYHAIMNGEKEFGATLHYMDENFDTGAIIDVWHFPIQNWMTAGDVSRDAIETSKAMFEEYFPQILEDFPFATIENVGGVYYKKSHHINDVINLGDDGEWLGKEIRAIHCPPYYPKIEIGGKTYKIVRED